MIGIKEYFKSWEKEKVNEWELTDTNISSIYKTKDFYNLVNDVIKENKIKKLDNTDENYEKMKRFLVLGYNIILYGVGNKEEFIDKFINKYFSETLILYVNSNSHLKIINILIYIITEINEIGIIEKINIDYIKKQSISKVFNKFEKIMNELSTINEYVLIYLTDICGKNFKDKESQLYLSKIFSLNNIMAITTVENAYYPMILTRELVNKFSFVYFCVNTFIPYNFSNIQDKGEFFVEKNKVSYESFQMILINLTDVQQELMIFLLKTWLDNSNWIEKKKFYNLALNEMLVSNENQLNDNLREAIDHKILIEKKIDKGTLFFKMPYELSTMKKLYQEVSQDC